MKKVEVPVQITVSQLISDLSSGMTWLEKDNEGYGSIQSKYNASDIDILTIKKHPKLAGIEPSLTVTVFQIIDDLKDDNTSKTSTSVSSTKESGTKGASTTIQQPVLSVGADVTGLEPARQADILAADAFDTL